MRTGKIQIRNCRLGPGGFNPMWPLSSTLRRTYPRKIWLPSFPKCPWQHQSPSQDYSVAQYGGGRRCSVLHCSAHCPLSLRLCPLPYPAGVTLLPFRDFYIWGNLPHRRPPTECHLTPSRQSGSPLERWSAFAKLRSTTNFAKIIHMLIVSRLRVYVPVDS
jgi:hypothetical protein